MLELVKISKSKNLQVAYLTFKSNKEIPFKPGQFLMLDNGNIKRAYSIASGNDTFKEIGFYIKKVSENGMSKYFVEDIKLGDKVNYTGPFGHMYIDDESKKKNYLFISTGSGIGPMLSIYKSLIYNGNYSKIVNIFGERYKEFIVEDTLKEIKSFESESVKNYIYLSREDIPGFKKGYVQNSINDAINFLGLDNITVFICGKPDTVDDIVKNLIEKGIKKEYIKFEKY